MIWKILFWVSVLALFYNYLIYPFILMIASRAKTGNQEFYTNDKSFPTVSILLAVYNEEDVLEEKLNSLFHLIYPAEKIEILVGSDASTDKTNDILKLFTREKEILKSEFFEERMGKVKIINKLANKARGEILIITDANTLHEPNSLKLLVRNFKNRRIGLVDSVMSHSGLDHSGISIQETTYVKWESKIKKMEAILWGSMMGPSGGFYAIRKDLFHPVPENFLVDDFYINMKVLENRFWSICEPLSIVVEDVSNNWLEE
ncbi:MAG: glycosyltransferase, partial [Bacteroidota bacterium]|nr:glycosyltransferase [Bacteroidota bacterium]